MSSKISSPWTLVVTAKPKWLHIDFGEIWRYRDLVLLLFKRDLVTVYKQTILGPVWYILQPLLTTLIFSVVFGNIAGISTDGQPQILFYLSGILIWNYFAECFKVISDDFTKNKGIYGKVYFPRVVMPLSTVLSNLVKFAIQFMMFIGFYIYFSFIGYDFSLGLSFLLLPILVLITAGLSLGLGMIFSSLTAKYRDLKFLISFGIQLMMYTTPVIYPLSEAPEKYRIFILANPMSAIVETFRYCLLGSGSFDLPNLLYSLIFMIVILALGLIVFNRTQKTFMDTI